WANASPTSFAVLPPSVSGFFVRWLSQYQCAMTHSRLDRAVAGRYFAFLVLSQLVVFRFIKAIFSELVFLSCGDVRGC
ncbi:hypothetical protein PILCRDRAFT_82113, partial [Piloderma croceum F 1598]